MIICRASCKITKNLSISCQGAWECAVVCGNGASPSPTVCESALSADYYYYKIVDHLLPIDLYMHQVDRYAHPVDGRNIPPPLPPQAPDVMISDLDPRFKLNSEDIKLNKVHSNSLGKGGFGEVYKAKYKGEVGRQGLNIGHFHMVCL